MRGERESGRSVRRGVSGELTSAVGVLRFRPITSIRTRGRNMSQHSSLKSANKITAKRNVLKRFERIDLLQKRGKRKEGDRALGLPKTKPE